MKISLKINRSLILLTGFCLVSCEEYLEVPAPNNKITSEVVFSSDETALSAMTGIYNQLYIANFSAGWQDSVTVLAGLSGDNIETIRTTDLSFREFQQNEILPNNDKNLNVWSSAYNIIYLTNSLLEGIANSQQITPTVREKLVGEAKFVRAFTYFYLVNLYGEVPLILKTDYKENSLASQSSKEEVNNQIILDLNASVQLLSAEYPDGERTYASQNAAKALLAREYLYQQNWGKAEALSSEIIEQTSSYRLLDDLNQVFLANSQEAIWQLSPVGRGNLATHTNEGSVFIIHPFFSSLSRLKLSENLISSFQSGDKRLTQWIAFQEKLSVYYPFKYKIRNSTEPVSEYSMVLRLAEQYLIRAEARARQGNLAGAIADVDIIRNRASLQLITETNQAITGEQLLEVILEERRKELFAEWGHRWLDLKRNGKATEVLSVKTPLWQETDVLYPIPAVDRMKNPNLDQNPGY
jgi:hypothetical protein